MLEYSSASPPHPFLHPKILEEMLIHSFVHYSILPPSVLFACLLSSGIKHLSPDIYPIHPARCSASFLKCRRSCFCLNLICQTRLHLNKKPARRRGLFVCLRLELALNTAVHSPEPTAAAAAARVSRSSPPSIRLFDLLTAPGSPGDCRRTPLQRHPLLSRIVYDRCVIV